MLAHMNNPSEFARPFQIPYEPDYVLCPTIFYGGNIMNAIIYLSEDEESHVRLTFEKLDALKVCRGEYFPYKSDLSNRGFMYVVDGSHWLRERHAYEAEHYRGVYEWGNNVDDMLTELDHYLFVFHDEFVEFIAGGIWFEKSSEPFGMNTPSLSHPLMDLSEENTTDAYEQHKIKCFIRSSQREKTQLIEYSKYCSQPLYHFVLQLDGSTSVTSRFSLRTRQGITKTTLRDQLGRVIYRKEGVISLEDAKALMDPYILAVHKRRCQ